MAMLKKNGVSLNFACADLHTMNQPEDFPEAFSDAEGLVWQVSTSSQQVIYYLVGFLYNQFVWEVVRIIDLLSF